MRPSLLGFIVERDDELREAYVELLRDFGITFEAIFKDSEILKDIDSIDPDFIIYNVYQVPDPAITLLAEYMNRNQRIKILLILVYEIEFEYSVFSDASRLVVLHKPFSVTKLIEFLSSEKHLE